MAFEDRGTQEPVNPTERNLKPYTCTTMTKRTPPNYLKIVPSYIFNPYFQPAATEAEAKQPENRLQENQNNGGLNFSISNILRPEFGLSAIRTHKKEGPKPGGPTQSILYKPYEVQTTAPLGSLCNTVSRIGSPTFGVVKKIPPTSTFRDEHPKRPDSANSTISTSSSTVSSQGPAQGSDDGMGSSKDASTSQWPAWVFCTRYSDRPSSGPRSRRSKKTKSKTEEEKRPRTAFSGAQLARLKHEFNENRYLTERRRQQLSAELGLNETQIKIWFQNKRAKIKKSTGQKNPLALQLMAQGLYNHSTASCSEDEEDEEVNVM